MTACLHMEEPYKKSWVLFWCNHYLCTVSTYHFLRLSKAVFGQEKLKVPNLLATLHFLVFGVALISDETDWVWACVVCVWFVCVLYGCASGWVCVLYVCELCVCLVVWCEYGSCVYGVCVVVCVCIVCVWCVGGGFSSSNICFQSKEL